MDDDELERFLREQKAKIARDQAQLERDLPYMEMQAPPKQHTQVEDHNPESMKENIPQKGSNAKFKHNDDPSNLGLPLGAEYEKKKQKLKEQLWQDYRRYLAEKNFRSKGVVAFEAESTPSSQPPEKERPRTRVKETLAELLEERGHADRRHEQQDESSSRKKDAATSMEAYEELLNEHRRGRIVSFEDGLRDPWTARLRHTSARHQSGGELTGEREERKEQEERTKSATTRHAATHAPARAHGILPVHEMRCSLDKRRKERYRLDLLEQMAEREQNKRREKQWRLAVPVSGVVDPQKDDEDDEPLRMLKMLGTGATERPRHPAPPRDVPPPDRPRRAFHTPPPPPDNNDAAARPHADGFRGTRTTALPAQQHGGQFYPASFATPYDPAYYYYAVHNPLESGLPPFESGHLGPAQPLPYYDQTHVPPPATHFANHWDGGRMPQARSPQHNTGVPLVGPWTQVASSQAQCNPAPRPPQVAQIPRGLPGLTVGLGEIGEASNAEGRRGSVNKYQEDLQRQIKDSEEKKRRERMERDRQDARLEVEANTYNPWGKGGGGAPLRDEHGNLVTDLKQMRRQNEAAVQNPLRSARQVALDSSATPASFLAQLDNHGGDHCPGMADDAAVHRDPSGQGVRGGTLLDPSLPPQAAEQERYKDFLRQQIEEKRRREAEEREKIREEEEREERRLAEQLERIQRECEEEAKKKRQKEEEQKMRNEELARVAEERKKEVERKRKEDEEKRTEEYRQQLERERRALREEVEKTSSAQNPQAGQHQRNDAGATDHQSMRGASPPIPALVKRQGFAGTQQAERSGVQVTEARFASPGTSHRADASPRSNPPSRERRLTDQHSRATTTANGGSSTGRGSPPVPARYNQLRTEGKGADVLGELSLFRKQLQSEQRRLESQLRRREPSEERRDARSGAGAQKSPRSRAASRDVFEMARMRMQAPVRRPSSKGVPQAGPLAGHHAPPPTLGYPGDELLDIQRSALARDRRRRHDAVRRPDPGSLEYQLVGMNARDLGLNLPQEDEVMRASRSSMLQSDSAFIGAFGEVFPTDSKGHQAPTVGQDGAWEWEPDSRDIRDSPRERRRQRHGVLPEQRPMETYEPRRPPASPSLLSEPGINFASLQARNAERIRRLQQMTTPGDDLSLGDPDDILSRFASPSRPYSAVTTATDVWLRPGSSDSPGGFTQRSNGE